MGLLRQGEEREECGGGGAGAAGRIEGRVRWRGLLAGREGAELPEVGSLRCYMVMGRGLSRWKTGRALVAEKSADLLKPGLAWS